MNSKIGGGIVLFIIVLAAALLYVVITNPTSFRYKGVGTVAADPCSEAGECESAVSAIASHGCAPWDAITVDVSFLHAGKLTQIQIYPKGLESFNAGRPVVIKGGSGSLGSTGSAMSCATTGGSCKAYVDGGVTVSLPKAIINAAGVVRGFVELEGVTVPLDTTWDGTHQACG